MTNKFVLINWNADDEESGDFVRAAQCLSHSTALVKPPFWEPKNWQSIGPKHLSVYSLDDIKIFVITERSSKGRSKGPAYALTEEKLAELVNKSPSVRAFVDKWTKGDTPVTQSNVAPIPMEVVDELQINRIHDVPFSSPVVVSVDQIATMEIPTETRMAEWHALKATGEKAVSVHSTIRQFAEELKETYVTQMRAGQEIIRIGFSQK